MNLKLLIWLLSDNVEPLYRAFAALQSRYGVNSFDIAGTLGKRKLFFNGKEQHNITVTLPPPPNPL